MTQTHVMALVKCNYNTEMKTQIISGIYEVRWMNRKTYIGSSIDVRQRLLEHHRTLKANKHHSKRLQRTWNKYGSSGFEFHLIEACPLDRLFEREQFWIDSLCAATHAFGMNMLPNAGTVKGHKASIEARMKMSASRKGKKNAPFSAETRQRMSETRRGRKLSPSHIESMRKAATGRKHTPASIEKMSRVQKGRPVTEKQRETRTRMNREEQSHLRLREYLAENNLASPNQKLRPNDIDEMRRLLSSGIPRKAIAERFKVNRSTIYRALRGVTSYERQT